MKGLLSVIVCVLLEARLLERLLEKNRGVFDIAVGIVLVRNIFLFVCLVSLVYSLHASKKINKSTHH